MIRVLETLRQWLLPAEYRIAETPAPDALAQALDRAAAELERSLSAPKTQAPAPDDRVLRDLANQAWDLNRKLLDPATRAPRPGMERESRQAERLLAALERAGVVVQDHTGEPHDDGQSLKVAARVPAPGLSRARVSETLQPTIYLHERRVQQGEVIVETPAPEGGA